MLVVMQMNVLQAVPMVNLTVVMVSVSMAHGHVTDMVTVPMAQMKLIAVVAAVPMVNMTVVPMVVHMVSASMAAGHVMDWLTVLMAQMKLTVNLKAVPMVNLTVAMDLVSMAHGHVTAMVTVLMAQTKQTVLLHHVKTKVYGIVVMANVSQHHMYVMAQVNSVTQAGVLTVPMVQMKA